MKKLLMIAFHFPPAAGSSGIQRTLRFVRHLPAFGWQPTVLTVTASAHPRTSQDLMAQVPADVRVLRALALDTARHLALAGRYPGALARPDRWQTWRFAAVAQGAALLRRERFDAVWSTYPIATAHVIGAQLQRKTALPWIADFRDPMAQDGYPADPKTWRAYALIEQQAMRQAARCVFTTPGAAQMYRQRYAGVPAERCVVIENGFDEEAFDGAEGDAHTAAAIHPGRITLLHSGIVYPSERDPAQLIEALALLKREGAISAPSFGVRFRASEHDGLLRGLAERFGVADLIELAPPVGYRDALREMLRADALLVMQASNCNAQIPAKLYEYLRARRPILGLTDPAGDTARVLERSGVTAIAPLDSTAAIAQLLRRFVAEPGYRGAAVASAEAAGLNSRRARAAELAALLNAVSR